MIKLKPIHVFIACIFLGIDCHLVTNFFINNNNKYFQAHQDQSDWTVLKGNPDKKAKLDQLDQKVSRASLIQRKINRQWECLLITNALCLFVMKVSFQGSTDRNGQLLAATVRGSLAQNSADFRDFTLYIPHQSYFKFKIQVMVTNQHRLFCLVSVRIVFGIQAQLLRLNAICQRKTFAIFLDHQGLPDPLAKKVIYSPPNPNY